jgi:signal transduction histidine kinase
VTLSLRELRLYSNRKVFAALAAMILVTIAATGTVIYCLDKVLQVRQDSIQITKVQSQLDTYYIQLLNAETGQRGYLLTGSNQYLVPYTSALANIPREGKLLQTQSAPYPYTGKVKQIRSIASDMLAELRATVTAYQQGGLAPALTIVQTGRGQSDMNKLRGLVDQIGNQQSTELAAKRTLTTNYGVWGTWIGATLLVLVFALAGLVYYLFLSAIKMERGLDEAKSEFVALASHQLRTPASAIKSILSMLAAEDFGALNKGQHHLVDRAIQSNEREIRIVDDLLNVARADAGRLALTLSEIDLRKIIDGVVGEQQRFIDAKRQKLSVMQPDHPVRIVGDEEKLFMAISNLVDNATKYTDEQGSISLSLQDSSGEKVCLEVVDTGVGIEQEDIERVFDRFGRAQNIVSTGVAGTGLGLYLANHIAELHHGTIKVSSTRGKGSTFTLILPREGGHFAT